MNKNFKIRHDLLKLLQSRNLNVYPSSNFTNTRFHFSEICESLPTYETDRLLDNLDYLWHSKEIFCSEQGEQSYFAILSTGSHSVREKKYLRDGYKDALNYYYDFLKVISITVLLAIAVWTFFQNLYQTTENRNDIRQMQKEIIELRKNLLTQPNTKK